MKFCYLFLMILVPGTLACGDVILGSGSFETPNYPFDYYDYADCVWYVKSNTSRGISLYFESFATEPTYDYVTVWEGWDGTGQVLAWEMSGVKRPFYLDSFTASELTIYFHSDISNTATGFRANFSTTPCSEHVLTEPNGTITSPRYPDHYPNKVNCQWMFFAPPGARVRLSFSEFDTETGYDIVQVFDGPSVNSTSLLEHSGPLVPADSMSTSNIMLMLFTTDPAGFSFGGWRAEYTFVFE